MPTQYKVRELIRAIRACKTAQDERDLIQKECANIRTSFKNDDSDSRARDVAKLLYIHMLGYPAHFGQMECIKLIASPRFSDKRMGYFGAMLLLDEKQGVHLLITNSMKNDMGHQVQYVVGLALCALGSICSEGMSRDLSGEVEKLLKSSNPYIVRKAALCAARIVNKVPDLMEVYVPTTRQLLNEKNHGVLLTGVCLVTEMCKVNPDSLTHFRRFVPNLVRILKNLIMSGYSPEHDIHGACDPFLQVRILRLLKILGKGDMEASEAMNDILAQVATNTDSAKNVGHAILYETVLTIMEIKSESGLRVLAINILGRFLSSNDKNVRYVALNTLLKTVAIDYNAVQRHRSTILDCLKENDISIRRRALELSFALISESNIRSVMKEILAFLDTCETEFKSFIASNVLSVAEKHSPSKKWHLDTILTVLIKAGLFIRDDLVSTIIAIVSDSGEIHAYIVQRLFVALSEDMSQQPLSQIALWALGEYGDLLITGQSDSQEEAIDVNEDQVLDIIELVMQSPISTKATKEYAINAIMKLSTRFSTSLPRIKSIVSKYRDNLDMELQQRAVEYSAIFGKHDQMRTGLLERMPVMSIKASSTVENVELQNENNDVEPEPKPQISVHSQQSELLDLLGDLDTTPTTVPSSAPADSGALLDLAGVDIQPTTSTPPSTAGILDLLGGPLTTTTPSPAAPTLGDIPDMTAFEKNGLKVVFSFQRSPDPMTPSMTAITVTSTNSSSSPMTAFVFQCAVPKTIQLEMLSPSGNQLAPNCLNTVTQVININNPQKEALRMRVRIGYMIDGRQVQEQGELNQFPEQLLL